MCVLLRKIILEYKKRQTLPRKIILEHKKSRLCVYYRAIIKVHFTRHSNLRLEI